MRERKVGRIQEGFILGGFCPIVKPQQAFNFFWETGSLECREWEATLHQLAWQRPCCAFPVNPFPDTALFPFALDLARAAPAGRSAVSKAPQEAARPRVFSAPSSSRFATVAARNEKPVSLPARGRAVLRQNPYQKSPAQTSRCDPATRRWAIRAGDTCTGCSGYFPDRVAARARYSSLRAPPAPAAVTTFFGGHGRHRETPGGRSGETGRKRMVERIEALRMSA